MKSIRILFFLAILTVTSCGLTFSGEEHFVARVGNNLLLQSEIEGLVPLGTTYNDSIAMIQQYINSWALKYLLITKAEKEIPGVHNSVSKEVEDYRNSLLAYRYEKRYIEQRLDTLVSEAEGREYFFANQDNFILSNSAVKSRVIKISSSSPNLVRIKSMYKTENMEETEELERICYNSADKYINFDNQWVDISLIIEEMPMDINEAEKMLKQQKYIEVTDSLYSYLSFFPEVVAPNSIAPYEFYQPRIKEIIIGKRKQELIETLKKDLMKEALENNILVTTINK